MVIFSYTGFPQVEISQKVSGGATFLTHTVSSELKDYKLCLKKINSSMACVKQNTPIYC